MVDQSGNVTSYSYDSLERLTKAVTTTNTGTTTAQYQYTYDGDGNLLTDAVSGPSVTASTTSYAYNPGNEICWSYNGTSTNACGSPPSGADSYSYDANGNELSNGNGLAMSYNALGQTTSIDSGGATTTYSYLGEGQGVLASEGTNTVDTEPYGVAATTGSSGSTYFTRAPSGQLLDERTSGGTYDYLFDGDGNVVGLTNGAGALVRQVTYGPYGTVAGSSGSINSQFGYHGAYTTLSGLDHFGARFLDPAQASWTQQDPLSQVTSLAQQNRFPYAGDDPINNVDPSGQASVAQICTILAFSLSAACNFNSPLAPLESRPVQLIQQAATALSDAGDDVLKITEDDGEELGDVAGQVLDVLEEAF